MNARDGGQGVQTTSLQKIRQNLETISTTASLLFRQLDLEHSSEAVEALDNEAYVFPIEKVHRLEQVVFPNAKGAGSLEKIRNIFHLFERHGRAFVDSLLWDCSRHGRVEQLAQGHPVL